MDRECSMAIENHTATRDARGSSILEVLLVLALLGILSAAGLNGVVQLRDRWAVLGARDALAALVRDARGVAVARGGSSVRLGSSPAEAFLEVRAGPLRSLSLAREWGVGLDLGNAAQEVVLGFDPAGVGRMSARTLRLTRGRAEAVLVVSGYGRVRR